MAVQSRSSDNVIVIISDHANPVPVSPAVHVATVALIGVPDGEFGLHDPGIPTLQSGPWSQLPNAQVPPVKNQGQV